MLSQTCFRYLFLRIFPIFLNFFRVAFLSHLLKMLHLSFFRQAGVTFSEFFILPELHFPLRHSSNEAFYQYISLCRRWLMGGLIPLEGAALFFLESSFFVAFVLPCVIHLTKRILLEWGGLILLGWSGLILLGFFNLPGLFTADPLLFPGDPLSTWFMLR